MSRRGSGHGVEVGGGPKPSSRNQIPELDESFATILCALQRPSWCMMRPHISRRCPHGHLPAIYARKMETCDKGLDLLGGMGVEWTGCVRHRILKFVVPIRLGPKNMNRLPPRPPSHPLRLRLPRGVMKRRAGAAYALDQNPQKKRRLYRTVPDQEQVRGSVGNS